MSKVIQDIQKTYGQGSIYILADNDILRIPRISTGSIGLDIATGGGLPEQRITVIVGGESSGKSTLSIHMMTNAQQKYPNRHAALVDTEFAFDPTYAKGLGIDMSRLLVSQPDTAQDAWGIIEKLVVSGEVALIVLDSIATMVTLAEVNSDYGDATVAANARLNGQALRKITPLLKKHNVTLVLINQWRMSIGGFGHGDPRVMPGGNSIKYAASIIMDLARKATNKEAGAAVSNRTIVKVKKNKTARPFTECEFDIAYGEGIDTIAEVIDFAVEHKIIQKGGAWFTYPDTTTGEIIHKAQGKPNMRDWLRENSAEYGALRTQVLLQLGLG